MKLTPEEVSGILDAWVQLQALGGILDSKHPESHFPQGRLKLAREEIAKAIEAINPIVGRPDFEENCKKKHELHNTTS